jgi:hypothetical protein
VRLAVLPPRGMSQKHAPMIVAAMSLRKGVGLHHKPISCLTPSHHWPFRAPVPENRLNYTAS